MPPASSVSPESPGLIPASGELAMDSMSSSNMPIIDDGNHEFQVSNYPVSEGSEEDTNQLTALGLHPTLVGRPGSSLGLGTEVPPGAPVAFHHFLLNPEICLIMPSDTQEIVKIEQRQYYTLPATHRATGAPVYWCSPVEMGLPAVIFTHFPQFIPLQSPHLPDDCNWLAAQASHSVDMVVRCQSFP